MTVLAIKNAILSSNSRCFTVTFLKLDGTIRTMFAKVGVQRFKSKNKKRKYTPSKTCIRVLDMETKQYKSILVKNLISYRCGSIIIDRTWVGYYIAQHSGKGKRVELRATVVENFVKSHNTLYVGVLGDHLEEEVVKLSLDDANFVSKLNEEL